MRMLKTYSSKHTRTITVANGHNSHRAPADGDSVDVGEEAEMGMKMYSSKRTGPMSP